MEHNCPDSGCLYCMVTDLYKQIADLKTKVYDLAKENICLNQYIKQMEGEDWVWDEETED